MFIAVLAPSGVVIPYGAPSLVSIRPKRLISTVFTEAS
jgi:hypothetical protein